MCVAAVAVGALHAVGRRHPRGRAPALPHAGLRPGECRTAAAAAAASPGQYDDMYRLDDFKLQLFKKKLYCLCSDTLLLYFVSPLYGKLRQAA